MASRVPPVLQSMRRHLDALYVGDADGRLLAVNDGSGKAAPRFLLGRTVEGCLWRFGAGLPDEVVERLERVCRSEPPLASDDDREPLHRGAYIEILARHAEDVETWSGPCYSAAAGCDFATDHRSAHRVVNLQEPDAHLLKAHLPEWVDAATSWRPMCAVVEEGQAVSICASVRQTVEAYEAGVETAPAFRRRGCAAAAVAAWIRAVGRLGVEPLYSTSWHNAASQQLAASLGLSIIGNDFSVM